MVRMTYLISALLVATGVGFYFWTGRQSVTALIPAFMGAVLALLAFIAQKKPGARMHVMHVAVLVTIAGIAATAKGVGAWFQGDREPPVMGKTLTCALLVVLLAAQVRSFIAARKARKAS